MGWILRMGSNFQKQKKNINIFFFFLKTILIILFFEPYFVTKTLKNLFRELPINVYRFFRFIT